MLWAKNDFNIFKAEEEHGTETIRDPLWKMCADPCFTAQAGYGVPTWKGCSKWTGNIGGLQNGQDNLDIVERDFQGSYILLSSKVNW